MSVRAGWSLRSTGSFGSDDDQGGTAQVHVVRGVFIPDPRKGERQRYCGAADCRRASKAASQAAWLARPSNCEYFRGPVPVARVQAWRAAHPGYSRGRVRPSRALQDLFTPQVPDAIEECADRARAPEPPAAVALQDLLNAESPLLAGLVAHLFQPALQDDMASTTWVVIGGDLNDTADSPVLASLWAGGFTDVQAHPTYPTDRPGTYGTGLAADKIDYLILSPKLGKKLQQVGIERRGSYHPNTWEPFDTVKSAADEASDHHLVWADFEL